MSNELSLHRAPRAEIRVFRWGADTKIVGDVVEKWYAGISISLLMPFSGGNVPVIVDRRFGAAVSCMGCPHLGVDKYGTTRCTHPFLVGLYGCPQKVSGVNPMTGFTCPRYHLASKRARRRYRILRKAEKIFWEYYIESGKNPSRYGFSIPRFGRVTHV